MTIDELNDYLQIAQEFERQAIANSAIASRAGVNAGNDEFTKLLKELQS